jgi:oxygen-independent coproporphyrinogen-3 oxidase
VQSLDDSALRFLGREHSARQAVAAVELGAKIFPRVSFDLIYARPGQDVAGWKAELARGLELAADHLSLYQLTIEPGTKFATEHARGDFVLPEEELAAALYDATAEAAGAFGLEAYEISNYAKPGGESRHNLAYWRYEDYAGIGPGAHSRLTLGGELTAVSRHRAPEVWAQMVADKGHGVTVEEVVGRRDRAREALLMGLRLAEGVLLPRFLARTGVSLWDAVDAGVLADCVEAGYLTATATALVATVEGRKRLDAVLPALVL